MKKILMFVIIGFLLIVAVIGVGSKIYIDKRAEQKEAEKIEAERMSVEALKQTFKDIESVEFEESDYNTMTGDYMMIVIMTNIEGESVKFDYLFETNHPEEIAAWKVVDEESVQKEGSTNHKVDIIFSDGSEGEE